MKVRFSVTVTAVAGVVWALGVSAAHAQSLADVAKREAERRGTVTASGKVYTNSDLQPDFSKPVAPAPAPAATPQPDAAPKAANAASTEEPLQVPVAAPGTEVERQASSDKGEDYWRGKAAAIRSAIAQQEAQIAALESNVQNFAEAKTGTDRRERDLSSATLAKAKSDLAYLKEDKARFEAVAQSKNVPAAWLR
jgi:hypothetical protein